MASRDEVLGLARETRDGVLGGAFTAEQLSPKGSMLYRIGTGDLDLDRLSPQDRTLIGLDATLMQQAGETVSGVAQNLTNLPKLVTEGLPRAGKAAWETLKQPTIGSKMIRRGLAAPEPVLGGAPIDPSALERIARVIDPVAWGLGLGENLMRLPSAIGAAAAELGPEKAKPLTHALVSNLPLAGRGAMKPFETNVHGVVPSRLLGKDLDLPAPPVDVPVSAPTPKPQLALPPAPPDPIVPPHARTRSMLPPSEQRALPPSSAPGGSLPPATEPIGATGEAGMRVLGEPGQRPPAAALPELPRRDVRPSSTETPPVIKADDLPPTTTVLDAQGKPITEPLPAATLPERERLRILERTRLDQPPASTPRTAEQLPATPEGPLPSAVEASSARRGTPPPDTPGEGAVTPQSPTGPLPPVPDQPVPGGKVPKPTAPGKPAPVTFKGHQEQVGGKPPIELWNLTEDIPGHPKGSTVARQTLESKGYTVPDPPSAPQAPTGSGGGPTLGGFVPPIPLPGPDDDDSDMEASLKRGAQAAGLALPVIGMALARGRGGRKQFGGGEQPPTQPSTRPPSVLPKFQTERIGPAPEGQPQPTERIVSEVSRARDEVRAPSTGGAGRGGEPPYPAGPDTNTPGAQPENIGRVARFFADVKNKFSNILPPEDVVSHDPAAKRIVAQTYRAFDDNVMLRRELEDRARAVYRGLNEQEIEAVNRVLDTADVTPDQYARLLPPRLAEVAREARTQIFDAGADATGLGRERRITGYFPRFRDRIKAVQTDLIQVPDGYIPRTVVEDLPKSKPAFFFKERAINEPPNSFGLDAVLVYQRAVARHLTLNGGAHPVTNDLIAGYLNEVGQSLRGVQPDLRQYTGEFINYFLGTPESRVGSEFWNQASRITRNVEAARTLGANIGSILSNATQQTNTLAYVRPTAWARGYADLLDPQRRALAQRWIGLEELGKADLEMVQSITSTLDKVEDVSAKLAHVSLAGFREGEKINRYHAFLAGLREAEGLGIQGRNAVEFARDIVDLSQFPGAGPAKIPAFRGPAGSVLGQFKQFQIRQSMHVRRILAEDLRDWRAALRGETEVPVMVSGRPLTGPDGPVTRDLGALRHLPFHRTAKYLVGLTALGGPEAIFPGLGEYLEEQGVKIPGLLPGLGVGIANLMHYGFITPHEFTRSVLFFLPGPLVGHVQDAASAATGVNFGRGLSEMLHGDLGRELSLDERYDRALRGFLPVAGVAAARSRQALKQTQTPGQDREARTHLEALGLEPATGPLIRRTTPAEPIKTAIGLPSTTSEQTRGERQALTELDERAKKAVELAADDYAAGDIARGDARLRDAEQRLKLPPGSLEVSKQGEKAAGQRRSFTPLERRQFDMRNRFPEQVEKSRRRIPGEEPDETNQRKGLGIPRLKLR